MKEAHTKRPLRLLASWDALASSVPESPLVLVIGAFDGIHIGHQKLINEAIDRARAIQGEAWLLTFDPHPSRVLRPDEAPLLLTSSTHKKRILETQGLDGVIFHPFTPELATCAPTYFIEELLAAMPKLHTIVVGTNWHFGHRAKGNVQLLEKLAVPRGIAVNVPTPVTWDNTLVSSTRIRQAVEAGHLEEAARMLGRPYSLLGTVTTGRQYGRQLGFPTANIRLEDEARPPTGVYAVQSLFNGEGHNGAAYLGIRPTDRGLHTHHLLEVHLFDVDMNLYDKEIEVIFTQCLRGDERFETAEALKAQIARDIQSARALFASGSRSHDLK